MDEDVIHFCMMHADMVIDFPKIRSLSMLTWWDDGKATHSSKDRFRTLQTQTDWTRAIKNIT